MLRQKQKGVPSPDTSFLLSIEQDTMSLGLSVNKFSGYAMNEYHDLAFAKPKAIDNRLGSIL
jgi:hypothetical protein